MKAWQRRALIVLGLVLASSVSGSGAALADAQIAEVGWWRSVAGSQPPEGGVAVGGNAAGPTAVAAIRVSVAGDAPLTAEVTLLEAGNIVGDTAGLVLCPTADEWTAAAGGSMDDAPAPDCESGSTPLNRDESGAWTAEVASLLTGETASLMIVPAPADDSSADPLAGAAPFEVSFEAPTLAATGASGGSGDGFEQPSSSGSFASSPSTDQRPPFAPIPIDRGASGFTAPPPPGAPAPPAETDQVAISPSAPVPTRALSDPGGGGGGRPWGQAVSYTLLAAGIGGAAGVGRWQLRSRGVLAG